MSRLAPDAAHQFGGIDLDRSKPLRFRLDGRQLEGFSGDTVLSAALANGIDAVGQLEGHPIALSSRFAPPVTAGGMAMPMDTAPALDGADYKTIGTRRPGFNPLRPSRTSLGHDLSRRADPAWLRGVPEETLTADLLVVGGGVAGLAGALAAAKAGRRVILCERRSWQGGDGRYFGSVGEDESPDAATRRLLEALAGSADATLLSRTRVLSISGTTALAHQTIADGTPHGRLISIAAERVVIATGATERLPMFPGNRLPGVVPAIESYHLGKRFGVAHGGTAVVSTQGNIGYRLALRLSDAGITVRRIVDARTAAQSRFIDFAKASGLILATGQIPGAVVAGRNSLAVTWLDAASGAPGATSEVTQLVVAGTLQPDLALWMSAGGRVQWNGARLAAAGHLDRVVLAGAVAGARTLTACIASGRSAASLVFGGAAEAFEDIEIGAPFETPQVPVGISPVTIGAPAFFDAGSSLTRRSPVALGRHRELSAGDVAAQVELGIIAPANAGAVAEEHGAPGGDIVPSTWSPAAKPPEDPPSWLAARLGTDHVTRHLVVDAKRQFERGALVYRNTGRGEPHGAIGVIVAPASPGGTALIAREHADVDRFIVEGLNLTSPARLAPEA